MNQKRFLTALCAAVLPVALALVANGCSNKDEETPPPQPSAAPTPTPTPTPSAPTPLVVEEDAGSDASDGGEDAGDGGKKLTGSADPTGVKKCCAALSQNANSAPLDQKAGYAAAAAACNGLVNNPQGRAALSQLRTFLRGANMPSSCQ